MTPSPPPVGTAEVPTASRRDRKRDATRSAIRAAAAELFLRHGFDAVPVEAVARAADVAPSTVYRHFPTKEDLVLGRLAERQVDFLDDLAEQPPGGTLGDVLLGALGQWLPRPGGTDPLLAVEVELILTTPALWQRLQLMVVDWEVPICEHLATRCGRRPDDLELRQLAALFCATVRLVVRGGAVADDAAFHARGLDLLGTVTALPAAALPG